MKWRLRRADVVVSAGKVLIVFREGGHIGGSDYAASGALYRLDGCAGSENCAIGNRFPRLLDGVFRETDEFPGGFIRGYLASTVDGELSGSLAGVTMGSLAVTFGTREELCL